MQLSNYELINSMRSKQIQTQILQTYYQRACLVLVGLVMRLCIKYKPRSYSKYVDV